MRTVLAVLLAAFFCSTATAQTIHHHHGASTAVDRFYSTWMKPDFPSQSCCNRVDCAEAEARFRDGEWWAKRKRDGKWLRIPPQKIEQKRDSPDGLSHLCASLSNDDVYCFVSGSGS